MVARDGERGSRRKESEQSMIGSASPDDAAAGDATAAQERAAQAAAANLTRRDTNVREKEMLQSNTSLSFSFSLSLLLCGRREREKDGVVRARFAGKRCGENREGIWILEI